MQVDPAALDLITSEGYTIREYLKQLLLMLWEHQEGFSGKRPFGNNDWEFDLIKPLVVAGYVEGNIVDENGEAYVENYNEKAAYKYIEVLIKNHLFK